MSNPSGGSNWTTNVNRAKTKRWVEAKSYSYDGDDWGDADEYGEYDEPKVAPKPTGLRKATAPVSSTASGQSPIAERERSNSFGRDDERRAFSGPTRTAYAQPQPSQPQPGPSFQQQSQSSPIPQQTQLSAAANRGPMLNANLAYDGRTASMTSSTTGPVSGRRKPSLGQADQAPMVAPISTNVPPPTIGTPDKPSTPTFIRPADIYRRMQEEREKERLSQESSRPSLSALGRDDSPAGRSDNSGRQAQGLQSTTSALNAAAPFSSTSNPPATATQTSNLEAPKPFNPSNDIARAQGPNYSPKLPEISGISGFGDDFGTSFMSSGGPVKATPSGNTVKAEVAVSEQSVVPPKAVDASSSSDPTLQHQPSFGYKSVVNQAFEQAVPPTPSTTSGSGIDRSNSDSTTNISPIISREVSNAVRPDGMRNIGAIAEEPAGSSRPGTSGSGTKRRSGTANPVDTSTTAAVTPSHRRETSLPSANNSPARTPGLETNQQLAKPQEAEIAITTPISENRSPVARDRSASPTKSRVRDLVDKIDSANNSRRGSQASLADKPDLTQPQRPDLDTKESFRPSLPGAWASYTTNTPPNQATGVSTPSADIGQKRSGETDNSNSNQDAFAKAAAAGSALAGALAAAAGITAAKSGSQSQHTESQDRSITADTIIHPGATRLMLPRNDSDATSSIVPTPLEMKPSAEQQGGYFSSVQPLQPGTKAPTGTTLTVPEKQNMRPADDMSTKSSPTDMESDRLRKEIVRELSPQRDDGDKKAKEEPQTSVAKEEVGYSSIYDSYLDEDEALSRKASEVGNTQKNIAATNTQDNAFPQGKVESHEPIFSSTSGPLEDVPESAAVAEASHSLTRQFSWEAPLEDLTLSPKYAMRAATTDVGVKEQTPSLQEIETQVSASTMHERTPSQPVNLNKQLPLPTADDNEANVPHMSESASPPQISKKDSVDTVLPPQPSNKVPAFREIMAIQSTPQRIQVYDQTRQTFANMDTGLLQWIQSTVHTLPEHEELLRNGGNFPVVVRPTQVPGTQGTQGVSSSTSRPSFGPSTGKSVKGKDLLHSAGVFGGKTSSAAKGLFAKGKSKWRGGADKASKRFRGLSLNSNGEPPSKLYDQQENIWETDASAPYFGDHAGPRKAPSKGSMLALDAKPTSQSNRPNDLHTIDSLPSNSISPPTTAPLDSPTLGRSNTITGGPISPLSGRTSFERKRASLAQKRASMEVPGTRHRHTSSFESHRNNPRSRASIERRFVSTELQARLTVHQNQMRSFGEEFPTDLIIPAEYRIPAETQTTPLVGSDLSTEKTPTQADFPKDVLDIPPSSASPALPDDAKKAERKGPGSALWLDTTGSAQDHTFDGPASPDYALRPQENLDDGKIDERPLSERPELQKHFSSLSFIQFDPVPSEDLALNVPVTPKRSSIVRERSDTATSSQIESQASESSFADYPAAEDFGALPADSSNASSSGRDRAYSGNSHSQQYATQRSKVTRQTSQSSDSTRSRSSVMGRAVQRLSKQFSDNTNDGQSNSRQEVSTNEESLQNESSSSFKRHSMLSDVRESREVQSYDKDTRQQHRKSLLGLGLSMKPVEASPAKSTRNPKFSLIPSTRKRTGTDLSNYDADPTKPSLTPDKHNSKVQRAATVALLSDNPNDKSFTGDRGKKKRFSGLSSFINKAKPRVSSVSNSMRGRSPTPLGTVMGTRLDSNTELNESNNISRSRDNVSLVPSQKQAQHQRTASKGTDGVSIADSSSIAPRDQLIVPGAHIRNYTSIPDISSNQEAIVTKMTAPPQEGPDYKSVYPPEFFGEQPPEGYYGPEESPEMLAKRAAAAAQSSGNDAATAQAQAVNEDSLTGVETTPKPAGPRPYLHSRGTSVEPTEVPPPPPPPKDPPKNSTTTTTTTTTSYPAKGSVKTFTETISDSPPQLQHESRHRGRNQDSISSLSTMATNVIPPSPVVHTATTKTVTKIANGRSVSPTPRSTKRSSTPIVPPLNILKKLAATKTENQHKRSGSTNNQDVSTSTGQSHPRNVTPQLTVDTHTGPQRPKPVEQFSEGSKFSSSDASQSNSATRGLAHPFVAKKSASPREPKLVTSMDNENASLDSTPTRPPGQYEAPLVNGNLNSTSPSQRKGNDMNDRMDDPVMLVQPLTIRKSPDLSQRQSPDPQFKTSPNLGLRSGPNLSRRETFEQPLTKSPEVPLPQIPNRISLHSPVLKDSPTLPRPTPPQSIAITPATVSSPIIPVPLPKTRPLTPPATNDPSSEGKEVVIDEAPISPLPRKSEEPTVRAMTPVEKMKDEPRVNEAAKESDESDDEIVMSSTAYPGQEWRPDYGYGGWDGYE